MTRASDSLEPLGLPDGFTVLVPPLVLLLVCMLTTRVSHLFMRLFRIHLCYLLKFDPTCDRPELFYLITQSRVTSIVSLMECLCYARLSNGTAPAGKPVKRRYILWMP